MAKCKNCKRLDNIMNNGKPVGKWCAAKSYSPDIERECSCEHYEPMSNADRIRSLTDEQLAEVYPCPYDTAGSNIMPCILDDDVKGMPDEAYCRKCMLSWLKKEVKE
jgi:hypothetical protein